MTRLFRQAWVRYRQIGLQWRIMLYVTAGLIIFSAIYSLVALQTVQYASALVFEERLFVARSFARAIDERLADIEREIQSQVFVPWSSPDNTLIGRRYALISSRVDPLREGEFQVYHLELLNEAGFTIYNDRPERRHAHSPHWKYVKDSLPTRQAATNIHWIPSGDGHIIAYVPLERVPWVVVIEQSVDEAFLLPRRLQEQFLIFGFVAVAAGLLLAFITTRRVVQPVKSLIRASHAIARGELDHTLDTSGEGEIGTLARAFADMHSQLRESSAEIARWNRELEARVDQRTRELRALVESSHALSSTLYLDALFEILMREARGVLPAAEGIALFMFDGELLVVRKSFGVEADSAARWKFRVGEGIAGRVFESAKPFLLTNNQEVRQAQANFSPDNQANFSDAVGSRSVQSALGVPLISKGTRLGALMTYNFSTEDAFAAHDVRVLQAFADHAATAIDNARLYEELQHKEEMRTYLLEKVIQAQEDERKRIARELHDELAQTLTALSIDLQSTARSLPPDLSVLERRLSETERLVARILSELSQLILELRPSVLDDLGLVPAIRRYAENRLEPLGTRVSIEAVGLRQRLPNLLETTLFRIVQETISNAAKHARAHQVSIRLRQANGSVHVEIEDDGVGFDAEDAFELKDGWRGLGLLGMRERAVLVGGTLTIDSALGRGTRVYVEVPWKTAE